MPTFSPSSGFGRWASPWSIHWGGGLWEVRSSLGDRIARVFFIIVNEEIILLHGIVKKSRTAPKQELDLARKRQSLYLKSIQ